MEDPVVGGYDGDRIAAARSPMAYDAEEDARVIRRPGAARDAVHSAQRQRPQSQDRGTSDATCGCSRALPTVQLRRPRQRRPARAPDQPAVDLALSSPPDGLARQQDELLQRNLAALGLRVEFVSKNGGPAEGSSPRAIADVAGGKHQRHVRGLHVPRCCTVKTRASPT
jgi:hypothetical protein